MNFKILLRLNASAEQTAGLARLQAAFAEVCNALGPLVQETRCWNRVALHHLAYRRLREQFPALGSQMVCNAIYSVSRSARLVYQNPASPWCIDKRPGVSLPTIRFAASAPVFFDRHTLSLKEKRLSMYTLDGRMRFEVDLGVEDEQRFREEKLKEILLTRDQAGFCLLFTFGEVDEKATPSAEMPEYLLLVEPDNAALAA